MPVVRHPRRARAVVASYLCRKTRGRWSTNEVWRNVFSPSSIATMSIIQWSCNQSIAAFSVFR